MEIPTTVQEAILAAKITPSDWRITIEDGEYVLIRSNCMAEYYYGIGEYTAEILESYGVKLL